MIHWARGLKGVSVLVVASLLWPSQASFPESLLSGSVSSLTPSSISLVSNLSSFNVGQPVTLTATANVSPAGEHRLRIFDATTGYSLGTCQTATCSFTSSSLFVTGGPHDYVAEVSSAPYSNSNLGGTTEIQATSNTVRVARSAWTVVLTSDRTSFSAGDSLTLTATANQNPGNGRSGYWVRIFDATTGQHLKTCGEQICGVSTPWLFWNGGPHEYVAEISSEPSASFGQSVDAQAMSNRVSVSRDPWTVSLDGVIRHPSWSYDPDLFTLGLIGTTNQATSKTRGAYRILFVDLTEGRVMASCEGDLSCSANFEIVRNRPPHIYAAYIAPWTNMGVASITDIQATSNCYKEWIGPVDCAASESVGGGNAAQKGCECSSGDPVNTRTGEFYENNTDLAVPGIGPAVAVTRTYSTSSAEADGAFGFGTTGNFGAKLVVDIDGDSTSPNPRQVHIVQENGATVSFTRAADGSYPAAPRVLATLSRDSSTGKWTFVRDKTEVFIFDSLGALQSLADLNGNTVTFGYAGGKVTSITGSGGRVLNLTWASGHVSGMTDSASRSVSYAYDTAGNLAAVTGADGSVTSYTYDSSHRLLTLKKPTGGITTNVYNATGQVVSQTDPIGRVLGFVYSGGSTSVTQPDGSVTLYTFNQGQPASVTSAFGTALQSTVSFTYDGSGNKVSDTDPLGKVTTYTFDPAGNVLTATDPLGNVTTKTYNDLREVTSVTDPLNRTTTMAYNAKGDLVSMTTPAAHTSTWVINSNGTIASATDALGKVTSITYDTAGRPLCTTDPGARKSCVAYDSRGLATTATDSAGKITTMTYDPLGRVLTTKDPNANITTVTYDGNGNVVSTTDAAAHVSTAVFDLADQVTSSTDARGKITAYTYTPRGSVASVKDPNGNTTSTAYDLLNRATSVTDAEGRTTSFGYDLAGRQLSTTMLSGSVISSAFDAVGRQVSSTDALAKTTTSTYDAAGQLTSVTDPLGRVTAFAYTAEGQLSVKTLPDGSTESSTYDARGASLSFTDADGNTTSTVYDPARLVLSQTQPGGLTTGYTYDTAGRVKNVTDPSGVTSIRTYDAGSRLTKVDYPGTADDVTYTYKKDNTRATMVDVTGTTTYTYDANKSLATVKNGNLQTIAYGYDNASRMTSITYPGTKKVTYTLNKAGDITALTDWAARKSTFTVTPDGLPATRTDPGAVTETRTYNANSQLTDIRTAKAAATLADYGYGYDAANQLTSSVTQDALSPTAVSEAWGYTALGQLSTTGGAAGFTTSHAGSVTATSTGDTFTYNAAQQLIAATKTAAGTSATFAYNGNGSRTTATKKTGSTTTATVGFGYDARHNLSSVSTVTPGGTAAVSYASNGDGLRSSRTTNGVTQQWLWDPNHAIPVLLNDGVFSYLYANDVTPVAQINNATGVIEYLHADTVGSVRTIVSATGAVAGTVHFTPYGVADRRSGTSTSAFGFATSWTDVVTGLSYLRAREYDPATTQFLQYEPAVNLTHQPYAYAANNPLSLNDPTGLCIGMDGTPQDRLCSGNDFYWSQSAQSEMWGQIGHGAGVNLSNIAFGIGDALTASPWAMLFGATSFTQALRQGMAPNIHCVIPENGFYYFGAIWAGLALGPAVAGVAGGATTVASAGSGIVRSLDDVASLHGASATEVQGLIPKSWVSSPTSMNKGGLGTRYSNPERLGEQIRIMPGKPSDPNPLKQGPYMRISRNGSVTDPIPLLGNPTL
jgi:RHS repeat-associated protein